jgi:hypothetical protein
MLATQIVQRGQITDWRVANHFKIEMQSVYETRLLTNPDPDRNRNR